MTAATTLMRAAFASISSAGEVIRSFTFAMLFGVFVGTYSSIFIAAPILIFLDPQLAGDALRRDRGRGGGHGRSGQGRGAGRSCRGIDEAPGAARKHESRGARRHFPAARQSRPMATVASASPACPSRLDLLPAFGRARLGFRRPLRRGHPPDLAPVFAEVAEIEVLLVGSGSEILPLSTEVRYALEERRLRADVMPTGAAARTYNIMLGENRRSPRALAGALASPAATRSPRLCGRRGRGSPARSRPLARIAFRSGDSRRHVLALQAYGSELARVRELVADRCPAKSACNGGSTPSKDAATATSPAHPCAAAVIDTAAGFGCRDLPSLPSPRRGVSTSMTIRCRA